MGVRIRFDFDGCSDATILIALNGMLNPKGVVVCQADLKEYRKAVDNYQQLPFNCEEKGLPMFGNRVAFLWKKSPGCPGGKSIFHNVTEVHWGFNGSQQVAFESAIHHTGIVIQFDDVDEFIVTPEEEVAATFDD